MDYDLAKRAVENASEFLPPDEAEALAGLVALFEPYKGDNPEEARQRQSMACHCANCGYETATMFHPVVLERAAMAGMRLAQCPRCFSTEMFCGSAPS